MKQILQNIFSIKNKDEHKVLTILGIKLKFKNNYKELKNYIDNNLNWIRSNENIKNYQINFLYENILDNIIAQHIANNCCNYEQFIKNMFENEHIQIPAWDKDASKLIG